MFTGTVALAAMSSGEAVADTDAFSERQERALLRALRDIDGHIGLWVDAVYFDPMTGERLAKPEVRRVTPDREVSAAIPNRRGEWWLPLVERGWIELPGPGVQPAIYRLTEAGRTALAGLQSTAWQTRRDVR